MSQETPESKFNIEKEDYNPDRYLQTLSRLFAHQEIEKKIEELESSLEDEMTDKGVKKEVRAELRKLKGQLLSDKEREKLRDASISQLQKDIAALRKDKLNTLEVVLESRQAEVKELIRAWAESSGDTTPLSRTDREALQTRERVTQSVRNFFQEVANRNGWEIGFHEESPFRGTTQDIFVSDGQRTVAIEPSLVKFEDRSVVGFNDDLVRNLGLSHIRKNADLRPGKNLDSKSYNFSAPPTFSLEDGWPNIERVPTKEEIIFLEKVISAYY